MITPQTLVAGRLENYVDCFCRFLPVACYLGSLYCNLLLRNRKIPVMAWVEIVVTKMTRRTRENDWVRRVAHVENEKLVISDGADD
jgi:hypothetical protein